MHVFSYVKYSILSCSNIVIFLSEWKLLLEMPLAHWHLQPLMYWHELLQTTERENACLTNSSSKKVQNSERHISVFSIRPGISQEKGHVFAWEQQSQPRYSGQSGRKSRKQMWSLRKVSGRLYTANHVFLACRVPWVSPMATRITINH